MGNSAGFGDFRLMRNGDSSMHIQLGKSVAIESKGRKFEYEFGIGNGRSDTWEVSYTGKDGLTCTLTLKKTTRGRESDKNLSEVLEIEIKDNTIEDFYVITETVFKKRDLGLLNVEGVTAFCRKNSLASVFYKEFKCMLIIDIPCTRRTTNAKGDVSETSVHEYGSGTRKGLIVREWKKKRGDHLPFMGAVAHYYTNTLGGEDVGLSVVVKIRVTEQKKLHFEVDGPVQHPTVALLYMFEQVSSTGVWRPTACPHCANIRRQPSLTFLRSESEDSDGHPLGTGQNRRGVSNRRGVYREKSNNGNFTEGTNNNIFL